MDPHMMLSGGVPAVVVVVVVVLWRLLRGLQPRVTGLLVRAFRDVITLRMVLRDSEPDERRELVAAHRAWRTEPSKRAGEQRRVSQRTPHSRARGGGPPQA